MASLPNRHFHLFFVWHTCLTLFHTTPVCVLYFLQYRVNHAVRHWVGLTLLSMFYNVTCLPILPAFHLPKTVEQQNLSQLNPVSYRMNNPPCSTYLLLLLHRVRRRRGVPAKHDLLRLIRPQIFLSVLCKNTRKEFHLTNRRRRCFNSFIFSGCLCQQKVRHVYIRGLS